MSRSDDTANESITDPTTVLALLHAVDSEESLTQRHLAARVGTALGLTNALIKRCIRKGLIKLQQAPARRYFYYLTPKGLNEKSHLVGEYVSVSLRFFRRARGDYADIFITCQGRGWTRIALIGTGELAEIAILSAHEAHVEIVAAVDPARNIDFFHGIPVVRDLTDAGDVEAVVIASAENSQEIYDRLVGRRPRERVLAPPLLHISPRSPAGNGAGA
jgi:DNA-binding MarR family transcriptional regulator